MFSVPNIEFLVFYLRFHVQSFINEILGCVGRGERQICGCHKRGQQNRAINVGKHFYPGAIKSVESRGGPRQLNMCTCVSQCATPQKKWIIANVPDTKRLKEYQSISVAAQWTKDVVELLMPWLSQRRACVFVRGSLLNSFRLFIYMFNEEKAHKWIEQEREKV